MQWKRKGSAAADEGVDKDGNVEVDEKGEDDGEGWRQRGGIENSIRLAALALDLRRSRLHPPYSRGVVSEDFRLGVGDEGFVLVLENAVEGRDEGADVAGGRAGEKAAGVGY